jgi:hypothetical protein
MVRDGRGTVSGTRKASTILHADFVDNGRLAGTDEDRALPRPRLGKSVDLIDPAIDPHDRQIIKPSADDGLLEFCVVHAEHHVAGVLNGSIRFLAGFQ